MQIKLYLNMLLERVDFIFRTNSLSETVYLLWMKVTPFRGSGYGGAKYKMSVYRNLGTKVQMDNFMKIKERKTNI